MRLWVLIALAGVGGCTADSRSSGSQTAAAPNSAASPSNARALAPPSKKPNASKAELRPGRLHSESPTEPGYVRKMRLTVPRGGGVLRASLTGPAASIIALEARDPEGREIARDEVRPPNRTVSIANLEVDGSEVELVVRVRPDETKKRRPRPVYPFGLVGQVDPRRADEEVEPNDVPEKARPLAPGATIRGFFHRDGDIDWYRVKVASGAQWEVRLTSPAWDGSMGLEIRTHAGKVLARGRSRLSGEVVVARFGGQAPSVLLRLVGRFGPKHRSEKGRRSYRLVVKPVAGARKGPRSPKRK